MNKKQSECNHLEFDVSVECGRMLGNDGKEPPVRFTASISIRCRNCELPFRFIGLPHGVDLNGAAVSVSGETAELTMLPKGEVINALDDITGFTIKRVR